MTNETALLLALLDRPADAEARLVYADWLEDEGQDDLAEWQRLHAMLPRFARTERRRENNVMTEFSVETLPRVFPTVVHMLADTCARFPDATALVCGPRNLTYVEYFRCVAGFAEELVQHGARGSRVALVCANSLDMPIAIFVVVGGSFPRRSSDLQSHTSGREKAMTKKGSIALEMMPENFHSVLSLAQYVSVEPFWKKIIQKTIEIT